jgi:hypothetical protein
MMAAWYFDDFYPDPEAIRSLALSGEWGRPRADFTGLEYRRDGFPMAWAAERVSSLLAQPLLYDARRPAVFRSLTLEQFETKAKPVHVDRMGFACVICLSHETGPTAKTSFYRHRPTGLTGVGGRTAFARSCLRTRLSPRRLAQTLDVDGHRLDRWDLVHEIPYRFNRLIIFDSNLFHEAGGTTGDDISTGKLTQNFNCWQRRWYRLDRRLVLTEATRANSAR